jgi:hypothetical protein
MPMVILRRSIPSASTSVATLYDLRFAGALLSIDCYRRSTAKLPSPKSPQPVTSPT